MDSGAKIFYRSEKNVDHQTAFLAVSGHFSFAHAQKRLYFYFRSEICCHHRSQRHQFPIMIRKVWQFDNVLVDLWPYCYCACAETAIFELPATILTTPLNSATQISHRTAIFRQSEYIFSSFFAFYRQNCAIFLLPVYLTYFDKSGSHVPLPRGMISTKFESDPTISYEAFTASTLRYIVTLMTDLMTVNGCREFFVTWSNLPPTFCFLRRSDVEL